MDSFKSTWAVINDFARAHRSEAKSQSMEDEVKSEMDQMMSHIAQQHSEDDRACKSSAQSMFCRPSSCSSCSCCCCYLFFLLLLLLLLPFIQLLFLFYKEVGTMTPFWLQIWQYESCAVNSLPKGLSIQWVVKAFLSNILSHIGPFLTCEDNWFSYFLIGNTSKILLL